MTSDLATPQKLRLEYASGDDAANPATYARRSSRIAWLLMLLPGLVVPFLPFACNASPAEVAWEGAVEVVGKPGLPPSELALWLVSLPFFLALALVPSTIRRLTRMRASRAERRVGLFLGNAAALTFAVVLVLLGRTAHGLHEWAVTLSGAAAIVAVIALEIVLLLRACGRDEAGHVAMLGAYAATVGFCLFAWYDDAKIGWFVATVPFAGCVWELTAVALFLWRTRRPRQMSGPSSSD